MPERTCIVCRRRAEKPQLLRFVVGRMPQRAEADCAPLQPDPVAPGIELDILQLAAGRGFYCHRRSDCLLQAGLEDRLAAAISRVAARRAKSGASVRDGSAAGELNAGPRPGIDSKRKRGRRAAKGGPSDWLLEVIDSAQRNAHERCSQREARQLAELRREIVAWGKKNDGSPGQESSNPGKRRGSASGRIRL